MVKIIGCTIKDNGVDFSVPGCSTIECLKCGYKENISTRIIGSMSCPKCCSSDVEIKADKK